MAREHPTHPLREARMLGRSAQESLASVAQQVGHERVRVGLLQVQTVGSEADGAPGLRESHRTPEDVAVELAVRRFFVDEGHFHRQEPVREEALGQVSALRRDDLGEKAPA